MPLLASGVVVFVFFFFFGPREEIEKALCNLFEYKMTRLNF